MEITMTTKTTKTKTAKPASKPAPATKTTRVATLHEMISREGGASVAEISEAFGGWEHHSCRGLISTSRRKHGWPLTTVRTDDGRGTVYTLTPPQAKASAKASASAKPAKAKAKRSRANA
jgi:hypothetical protein